MGKEASMVCFHFSRATAGAGADALAGRSRVFWSPPPEEYSFFQNFHFFCNKSWNFLKINRVLKIKMESKVRHPGGAAQGLPIRPEPVRALSFA